MKLNVFLIIYALVFGISGLMDLFVPETMASSFLAEGQPTCEIAVYVTKLFGIFLISTAILALMLRRASLSYGRYAGLVSMAFMHTLGVALQSYHATTGLLKSSIWIGNGLIAILTIGLIYYAIQEGKRLKERAE